MCVEENNHYSYMSNDPINLTQRMH